MAKPSSATPSLNLNIASPTIQINDMSEEHLRGTTQFLNGLIGSGQIPDNCNTKDFHSEISRAHLRQFHLERGRVACLLSVKPAVCNIYLWLFTWRFVAAAAEFFSIACARTVVVEDKDTFLGELSISYLSGAPQNAFSLASKIQGSTSQINLQF